MVTKTIYETPVSEVVQFCSCIVCTSTGAVIEDVIENDGNWDDETF